MRGKLTDLSDGALNNIKVPENQTCIVVTAECRPTEILLCLCF